MVGYHLLFDLYFFAGIGQSPFRGIGDWGAWMTASTFLTLVGVSLPLAELRRKRTVFFQVRRATVLLVLAASITLISGWLVPGRAISFGILHLIAISLLLAVPFRNHPLPAVLAGILVWSAQPWISSLRSAGHEWLWLGITPFSYRTLDYYPLVPWFGFVLVGIGIGSFLFPEGRRRYWPDPLPVPGTPLRQMVILGRHSLLIFLLHHPLLIGLALGIDWLYSGNLSLAKMGK